MLGSAMLTSDFFSILFVNFVFTWKNTYNMKFTILTMFKCRSLDMVKVVTYLLPFEETCEVFGLLGDTELREGGGSFTP